MKPLQRVAHRVQFVPRTDGADGINHVDARRHGATASFVNLSGGFISLGGRFFGVIVHDFFVSQCLLGFALCE